ncbi:hypothetical protein ACFVYP_39265 [Kitasatospora sp. NPDC058201]|uniref:hypothetical protein n=1 Tax=unclassified Kitasatospora TaxID=2633591 RepID=UPI00365EA8B2
MAVPDDIDIDDDFLEVRRARQLYKARDAGADQAEQERILAEGLREHYFKDGGHRARNVDVELNEISWMHLGGL